MRKARRIAVILLAFLICITMQKGIGIWNGAAMLLDAIWIIIASVIELRRK